MGERFHNLNLAKKFTIARLGGILLQLTNIWEASNEGILYLSLKSVFQICRLKPRQQNIDIEDGLEAKRFRTLGGGREDCQRGTKKGFVFSIN